MRASLSFFFNLLAQMWGYGTDAEAAAGLAAPLDSSGSTPSSSSVGGGRVASYFSSSPSVGGGRVEVVGGGRVEVVGRDGGTGGGGTVALVYSFSL